MFKKIKNKFSTTKKLYKKLRENKSNSIGKSIYFLFLIKFNISAFVKQAISYRKKLNIPIIAITGTNGKTTTKELIATILAQKHKLAFTSGNYNNHIGVPLTILSIDKSIDIAVIEMGANHLNEIKTLCEIAQPTHGLITNIGIAHLEGFVSFEGIKKTKNELYDFLKQNNGIIFINKDNNILIDLIGNYNNVISYGTQNVNCEGKFIENGVFATVEWQYNLYNLKSGISKSNLVGQYNFENILAAVTVGNFFNIEPDKINYAINIYFPDNKRSQYTKTEKNIIIEDYYNANVSSMKLAIDFFFNLENTNKCLILGDMLELGNSSQIEHEKILKLIENKFEKIFLVGNIFSSIKEDKFNNDFYFYNNIDDFIFFLKNNELKNKTILIKGSRAIHLEKCIEFL